MKDILLRWKSPALPEATSLSELQEIPPTFRLPTVPQKSPSLPPAASPLLVIISQSTTCTEASCFSRGHNGAQNPRGHAGLKNSRGSALLSQRTHLISEPQTTQARRPERKEKTKGRKTHGQQRQTQKLAPIYTIFPNLDA